MRSVVGTFWAGLPTVVTHWPINLGEKRSRSTLFSPTTPLHQRRVALSDLHQEADPRFAGTMRETDGPPAGARRQLQAGGPAEIVGA